MPTTHKSPHQQALEKVIPAVLSGQVPPEDLAEVLDYIEGALTTAVREFKELSSRTEHDPQLKEYAVRVLDAYTLHGEGLEELRLFLEDDNPEHLEVGMEMIDEATATLVNSFLRFDEMSGMEMMKSCVRCGHRNPPHLSHCQQCKAKLLESSVGDNEGINIVEGGPATVMEGETEYVMTSNLRKLLDACNGIVEGKVSPQEFEQVLATQQSLLDSARQDMAVMKNKIKKTEKDGKEEEAVAMNQVLSLYEEGISTFESALDRMYQYLDDPDQEHLIYGYKTALDAGAILNKIIQLDEKIKAEQGQSEPASEEEGENRLSEENGDSWEVG